MECVPIGLKSLVESLAVVFLAPVDWVIQRTLELRDLLWCSHWPSDLHGHRLGPTTWIYSSV